MVLPERCGESVEAKAPDAVLRKDLESCVDERAISILGSFSKTRTSVEHQSRENALGVLRELQS